MSPARVDVRQAAYAERRRAWRAEYLAWLAAGRPGAIIGGAAALVYQGGGRP